MLGQPVANPMVASSQVVNAYASRDGSRRAGPAGTSRRSRRCATPAASTCPAQVADPSQLTDEDLGLANVILTNGARLYVDHAHPEYSTPEVTTPRDIVLWDKAGERVMLDAPRRAAPAARAARRSSCYKNNTDNKGASYGTHENYLMRRATPFARHRAAPDAVLRQPPGDLRRRPGRASARTAASTASRSASVPTSSRSRSASRPPSSGRSSTPATSRTPTRRSTAGCT